MKDILVVDDAVNWQEFLTESISGRYTFDCVSNYAAAIDRLKENTGQYRLITVNLVIPESESQNSSMVESRLPAYKLLSFLRTECSTKPVVVVTGGIGGSIGEITIKAGDIQRRWPNVRDVLIKTGTSEFKEAFFRTVDTLLGSSAVARKTTGPPAELSNDSSVIRWVHLSDLHIGCSVDEFDWSDLKHALLDDLGRHCLISPQMSSTKSGTDFKLHPDLIFITGDVAWSGSADQYVEASSFLQDIWSLTGCGKSNTFMIPGNHDTLRNSVVNHHPFKSAYEQLANGSSTREDWRTNLYGWWKDNNFHEVFRKKFMPYLEFHEMHSADAMQNLFYKHCIRVGNSTVEILGINSSLMSWKDNEDRERGLWIGKPQLDSLGEDRAEGENVIRIALIHHPAEALSTFDKSWERLEEICNLILHGHLHELRLQVIERPGRQHACLQAASIKNKEGIWLSQRYYFGELDTKTGKMTLYLRKTIPGDEYPRYIQDIETPGADEFGRLELFVPLGV